MSSQVPRQRAAQPALFLLAKAELNRTVSILTGISALHDVIWPNRYNRNRNDMLLSVEYRCLPELLADQTDHKSNLNGDVDARRQIELLQFVDGLCRGINDIQ
jgi:hypothetical protein